MLASKIRPLNESSHRPRHSSGLRHAFHCGEYLFFLFLFTIPPCAGQDAGISARREIDLLRNSLAKNHVQPKVIDDVFSAALFDKIIKDLDPDRIYFSSADITALRTFRNLLDDEISGRETNFLHQLGDRFSLGLQRSQKLIVGLLDKPLTWDNHDMYSPEGDWAEEGEPLIARHRQWLKDQILNRMTELRQRDTVATADFFRDHLPQAVAYVRSASLRPIARALGNPAKFTNEILKAFLNGMAGMFDPHSTFFSAQEYEGFVAALSTEDYYYGFTLADDEKGNVVISALAPGGPAWKSGALHISDVVVSLKWPGEEKIEVAGMNVDDVVEILDANHDSALQLVIRMSNGTEASVDLRKEKLEVDENAVQSFILRSDLSVGYIYLPDFYTRWGDEQVGARCANDVAKEIIKLQRDGIDGLILDLRFNGGGSLFEAQAMAGIFIDEGPLAMMRGREEKAMTIKDMNRGTVYDGPLAVMVNGYSASASEVLAASIQDYNRGLIVGSRTYGKATGQDLLALDGSSPSPGKAGAVSRAGYAKITTERLYRVTGKSVQGRGVIPDVVIPDALDVINVRERDTPFALVADSIPMNPYYKPLRRLDVKELQRCSAERISQSDDFRELDKTIAWLKKQAADYKKPKMLTWENYLAESGVATKRGVLKQSGSADSLSAYRVLNSPGKDARLAVDEYARSANDRWKQALAADVGLRETYQIVHDYITLTKKP